MAINDTIKLLGECNAGIKMGVSAIDDALPTVKSENLRQALSLSKREHEILGNETHAMLTEYHDDGKEPSPVAKGMSWIKTNMKLSMKPADSSVAELITDGCNMGVKSLNKYLNEYSTAEQRARDIAQRLINLENKLSTDVSAYL